MNKTILLCPLTLSVYRHKNHYKNTIAVLNYFRRCFVCPHLRSKNLLFLMLFASISMTAQQVQDLRVEKIHEAATMKAEDAYGAMGAPTNYKNNISTEEYLSAVSEGDSIGFTVYDWQTNNSMQRRLHLEEDGTLHAVWTYGLFDDAFPGRGTGYTVRTDGVWGDIPNERIEDVRTGWPGVGVTASGRTYVMSHVFTENLHFSYKDIGDTDWTHSNVPNDIGASWPRTATDNDSIYCIVSRQDAFGGLNNGLAFRRSPDQGDTWEDPITLDFLLDDYGGVTIDCYDIDASGGTVAIILGGYGRQTIVYKSTDGGDNWDRIPLGITTAPTIVDGSTVVPEFAPATLAENVSLVVDDAGQIHVAGAWIFNFADANAAPSFAPDRGGILYWTEGMDEMELIGNTVAQDWDGNASNDYDAIDQATGEVIDLDVGWRFYSNVPVAMPSISVDENGNPFIAYASVVDAHFHDTDLNPIETYFREVFVVRGDNSGDGTSWEGPFNVSNDENTEDVFPCLPTRVVEGEVNILYMSDSEAGTGLQEDQAWKINGMKMVTMQADEIVTPAYIAENNGPNLDVFWTDYATIQGCVLEATDIPGVGAWDFPDGDLTEEIVLSDFDFDALSTGQELIFTVTDSEGNSVQDTVLFSIVEYVDVADPEITLLCPDGTPGCEMQTFIVGEITEYNEPGFIFSDDSECESLDESTVVINGAVDVTVPNIYTLEYTGTDLVGNSVTVSRTVEIIGTDTEAPTLTITAPDGTVINDGDTFTFEADDSVSDIPLDILITDNVLTGIEPIFEYGETGPPSPVVVGVHEVTVIASDGDNETSITYTVSVIDTTPPTFELQNSSIPTTYSSCPGVDGLQNIEDLTNVSDIVTAVPTLNSDADIPFDQLGTYVATYSYTDDLGNQSEEIEITYIVENSVDCWALGIDDIALGNAITISPNPTDGIATLAVDGNYDSVNVTVVDVQGKEIMILNDQNGTIRLNLSSMAAGIYYVKVQTDIATAVKKLIVE